MRSNKEWAKHIIKRFGKKEMYRWAIQHRYNCPCAYLKYRCCTCRFQTKESNLINTGCVESIDFLWRVSLDYRTDEIKELIVKNTRWWNRK